jgi:hypothetical protein
MYETKYANYQASKQTEIKNQMTRLQNELLELLDDWYDMVNVRRPQLEFMYESMFGDLEIELEQKSRSASELERRVELLSWKLKRGERINKSAVEFVDMMIDREFNSPSSPFSRNEEPVAREFVREEDARAQQTESRPQIDDSPAFQDEIPMLYRTLVKKLHPDVCGESEEFKRFWNNVQDAYKNQDVQRLRLFKQTLCPEVKIEYRNTENEMLVELRELENSVAKERRKLSKLRQQEPFVLEEKLNDRTWISKRRRALRDRLFQMERKITFNKKILNCLTISVERNSDDRQKNQNYKSSAYSGSTYRASYSA